MTSANNYPSSRYRPPTCTFQDFRNGLSFAAFFSLYQQLNPYNPPSLSYIQQHWIVLINELLPDFLDEHTQTSIVNPVGQELKFQAFASNGGVQLFDAGDKAINTVEQSYPNRCYKGWDMVDKEQRQSEVRMKSLLPDRDEHCAERERFQVERKRGMGIEVLYSQKNQQFTRLIIGEVSPEAGTPTDHGQPIQAVVTTGNHDHFRRCHPGKRAEIRKSHARIPELHSTVASSAFAADANAEEQLWQTGRTARAPTRTVREGGTVAADKSSLSSAGGHQGDVVHFRYAPSPECVDPCSLSQSELETAIADLLSTVQFEMNAQIY
jgi:hypothetical protein